MYLYIIACNQEYTPVALIMQTEAVKRFVKKTLEMGKKNVRDAEMILNMYVLMVLLVHTLFFETSLSL